MRNFHIRQLVVAMVALLCNVAASAYDFEVGGIYYNIIWTTDFTVEVSSSNSNDEYSSSIVIPEKVTYRGITYCVTSIGDDAFYNCSGLTSVIIPNSVTSIGNYAFEGCSGLTSVTIPNSVTSIGNDAFYDCSNLTSVTIPNSVTSIGAYAFYGTAWYNSQPDGVVYAGKVLYKYKGEIPSGTSINIKEGTLCIAPRAFAYCDGLTSITIPNSVTSIGDNAFSSCRSLTSITIPNSVTSIGEEAFYYCSSLTSVIIPYSVTSIGDNAFYKCSGLTSITIPSSVTSIGNYAFDGCSGLTSITIPNSVTSIGYYTFSGCSGLTSITIPNSVTSIGNWAFDYCDNLTSIEIPNSITSIGNYAFRGCSSLTSIEIPNNVTSIGDWAFYDCSGLKTVINLSSLTISKGSTDNGYVGYYADKVITVPNGSIEGDFAWAKIDGDNTLCGYIGNATELSLPENYKGENYVIGDNAFSGCSGLTSITIPNSVTSIGEEAFYNCSGLKSVTIPNSVTSIGEEAFDGTAWYNSQPDGVVYAGKVLYKYKGEIPSGTSINIKEGTLCIAPRAFAYCWRLTSITIPNSVTSIGNYAFDGCSGLKTVINLSSLTISKGSTDNGYVGYYANKVITVPNGSIEGDFVWAKIDGNNTLCGYIGNATELSLPENYKGENYVIGNKAFYNCSGLTSVTIPNSVTSIGNHAFSNCSGLTSVTIGNSVTNIGNGAFYGSGLRYIHIPNVNNIGSNLFSNCNELTKVSLNCKRVDNFFGENKNINELILGNNVIGILDNTLSGCSGIKTIWLTNSIPPKVGANNFTSSHYQKATLYVPKGSLATYQAADTWKDFWDIQEFDATDINAASADATVKVNGNSIALVGAENCSVAIYSTNSALIEKIDAYAGEEIILEKGVYIICIGSKSIKVKL